MPTEIIKKDRIVEKARGLITVEAIIAGFLFTSNAIQWQAMQKYWESPPVPASTFGVALINYCLIIVAVRCIWASLRALDKSDEGWYLVSYRLFVAVLLGTVVFNVLPSMISFYRVFLTQTARGVIVLPFEKYAAIIAAVITTPLVLFAFFYPIFASELLSRLWERKLRHRVAIVVFLFSGLVEVALGYPIIRNLDGTTPQQFGLLLGAELNQKCGPYLTIAGYISLATAISLTLWGMRSKTKEKERESGLTGVTRSEKAKSESVMSVSGGVSNGPHKLGLRTETTSTAVWKWWKFRRGPIRSYVERETYKVQFKFRNLAAYPFPGGNAVMHVIWPNGIFVRWLIVIPQLNANQTAYGVFDDRTIFHSGEVITSGYGLIFCDEISSSDQQQVTLTDLDGHTVWIVGNAGSAVHSIHARAWADLYARYSMIISAAGLTIVALEKIVASLMWLWSMIDSSWIHI
jgi:hypothetical protein